MSNPGILQVRRFKDDSESRGDMIYHQGSQLDANGVTMIDPADPHRQKHFGSGTLFHDLLVPIFRNGKSVYTQPSLEAIRERVKEELHRTPVSVKRFDNPHVYPVGLEQSLHQLKTTMIRTARNLQH